MKLNGFSRPDGRRVMAFFLVYNIFLTFLLPFFVILLVPVFLLAPRLRPGMLQRFGLGLPISKYSGFSGSTVIHAASVGELNGLASFLSLLDRRRAGYAVTTFTDTGLKNGRARYPGRPVFSLPFDHPLFLLPLFLAGPGRLIVTEGEIWPNLIMMARLFGVRAFLVNARITDRRLPVYMRFKPFYKMIFSGFTRIFCQDRKSLENFRKIGVDGPVSVAGSTKLDLAPAPAAPDRSLDGVRKAIGLKKETVVLGGSLRGSEHAILADAMKNIMAVRKSIILILVPRHLNRIREIALHLDSLKIPFSLYSEGRPRGRVVVVDKMGILQDLYRLSDIVFLGGTLEPVGGHNPVEPALARNAIIHGPSMENNIPAFSALMEAKATLPVRNAGELERALLRLLSSPAMIRKLKTDARVAILRCRGAGRRIYEAIFT